MTAPTQATSTAPLFSATLKPERSLHAAGGWIGLVLAGIVGTPFLIAMPEFLLPGLAAFGVAGTGLGAMGMRQARHKRQSQAIAVWPDQLELVVTGPGTQKQMRRFNSMEVRIRLVRDGYERTTAIFLRHGGEEIELGGFLSVDDKSSFAKAFGSALRQARRAV